MERTRKLEKKDGFMKGVLALMISQVLIKMLGLVSKIYLTNKKGFGDVGNGIYGSGYQIYALLLTISSIGVPNAIAKLISERVAIDDYKGAHRVFKISLLTFASITNTPSESPLIILFLAGKCCFWGFVPKGYSLITKPPFKIILLNNPIFSFG